MKLLTWVSLVAFCVFIFLAVLGKPYIFGLLISFSLVIIFSTLIKGKPEHEYTDQEHDFYRGGFIKKDEHLN